LAGVRSELEKSQAELVALRDKAAAEKASFEQQIARLENQLGKQRKLAASEKQRAEKAESAHSKSVSEVAGLRDADKKTQVILTTLKNDLKQTAADRDKLTAANAQLQKDMADITAAKTKADSAVQAAHAEIKKMKQDALEARKAAIVEEDTDEEKDPPKDDDDAAEDEPVAEDN
jgi:chromosome segregation ATPase